MCVLESLCVLEWLFWLYAGNLFFVRWFLHFFIFFCLCLFVSHPHPPTHTCMHICIHAHMHSCTCMHALMHSYAHMHLYTHMYACTHEFIHTHACTQTCICTHTHACTHAYIWCNFGRNLTETSEIQTHKRLKRPLTLLGQHEIFAHFRGKPMDWQVNNENCLFILLQLLVLETVGHALC